MAADPIEITYSILTNGVEIGFGTSGESATIDEALHMIHTAIQRGEWETTKREDVWVQR